MYFLGDYISKSPWFFTKDWLNLVDKNVYNHDGNPHNKAKLEIFGPFPTGHGQPVPVQSFAPDRDRIGLF